MNYLYEIVIMSEYKEKEEAVNLELFLFVETITLVKVKL